VTEASKNCNRALAIEDEAWVRDGQQHQKKKKIVFCDVTPCSLAEMCRRFRAILPPPLRYVKTAARTRETRTDLRTIASDDVVLAELPCQAYSQHKTTSGEFRRNATLFSIQSVMSRKLRTSQAPETDADITPPYTI
jgi:hypothetical protein